MKANMESQSLSQPSIPSASVSGGRAINPVQLVTYLDLKLALLGFPQPRTTSEVELFEIIEPLMLRYQQTRRLLASYLCPADERIQAFLYDYLPEINIPRLPTLTLTLDRPGMARMLSLPKDGDEFQSSVVHSYRLRQGVLHNPASDRRTTQGVFHVAEGGLPIPDDKSAVPQAVFANLLKAALEPPTEFMQLPFTANQTGSAAAHCWVSLLLRPLVCPVVPGVLSEKRMEIRFFAPASLVSNLDFVENIFGNGGDPTLPENDAGLDGEHWTGHTGCVILAPHLTRLTKKSLGLLPWEKASERQRRDGMCWKEEGELYNGGSAFKITARDTSGVIVTIIADNYYGYCKKEVKTQISYSANLFGQCEEEHAGGALVYAAYNLGDEFNGKLHAHTHGHSFQEVATLFGDLMDLKPEGFGVDRRYSNILYVNEDAAFDLQSQRVNWTHNGSQHSLKLLPGCCYVRPSGHRVIMCKPHATQAWRLIGRNPEPTLYHKPSTVSGGGKSEVSKSISDAILYGPAFIADYKADLDAVEVLLKRDYSQRFLDPSRNGKDRRPILSETRSVGSVIKLMTPSDADYTWDYNQWLRSIPQHVKDLLFRVKRFYQSSWGERWRDHFTVDLMNGVPGNELKFDGRKLVAQYLRVGYQKDNAWRVFGLRLDFNPSFKIQVEDDITASAVVPAEQLANLNPEDPHPALKFVANAEFKLFQRPDDAIHRGYDKQAEADLASPGCFISNFEPLNQAQARELIEETIKFDCFTEPMRTLIRNAAEQPGPKFFVSSAHPRMVDGKPTKNPRYLQTRPDLLMEQDVYLAEICTRLSRRVPMKQPLFTPVNSVIAGRRNNPPEGKIRPLAVFNPLHYLELPEAFMEFISSMTGKSPSTTGAGSEGALTKGPFNALPPIIDLNNALVSFLLTAYPVFISAAGYVGPQYRVDHDISLLVPEIWSRLSSEERAPQFLIANKYFEKCEDFECDGKKILASRLGYRMTAAFVNHFFGRIFSNPHLVLPEEMLKPELQSLDIFAEGLTNILETHKRVAEGYFRDESIALACPPLRALLHIMRDGVWEGYGPEAPEFRRLFTRDYLLASDWYSERLKAQQAVEVAHWRKTVKYVEGFLNTPNYTHEAERLGIAERLAHAKWMAREGAAPEYLQKIRGTLGKQPL